MRSGLQGPRVLRLSVIARWLREAISVGLSDLVHDLLNHAAIGCHAFRDLPYEDLVALAPKFHGRILVDFRHRWCDHKELADVEREGLRHNLPIPMDASKPVGQAIQSTKHLSVGIRLGRGIEKPPESF